MEEMQSNDPTLDVIAEECLVVRMRLLNRVITKIYNDALRGNGLTASQMNILVLVARRRKVRPAQVCDLLKMDVSTLSRNMERMRARGWILIEGDPDDGRAHQFALSRSGRKLLDRAAPAWAQAQEKAKELPGPTGATALARAAERARIFETR